MLDADAGGPTYDLIAVEATNGRSGFVDRRQHDSLAKEMLTSSPAGQDPGPPDERARSRLTLPVLAVDGTTRVGTFLLDGDSAGFTRLPADTDVEQLHRELDREDSH